MTRLQKRGVIMHLKYVTGNRKTDHLWQILNLRYVSSKFNSHYVNFDRMRYF